MSVINRAYKKDLGKGFGVIFFPGQTYAFYINFTDAISDPDFANFRLDLRKADAGSVPVATNISALQQDFVDAPYNIFYRMFVDNFVFPAPLEFGWYQFAIYDSVALVTKAVSAIFLVEEEAAVRNFARITWRNTINRSGINYEGNPGFYNSLTLTLIQTDFNIDQERKTYRNVSNRKIRNYRTFKDEVLKIESYMFDEEGHKAMSEVYDHDTIFLDLTYCTPKDAYSIEDRQLNVLSKGSINVIPDDMIPHPHPGWVVTPIADKEYLEDDYDGDFD